MTETASQDSNRQVTGSDRLMLVFAFGLWPFRSRMDPAMWLLAQGIASGLSQLPDLLAYASPRGLVDPAAADPASRRPVQVYRSLPPIRVVREEADALGATWAMTGRFLTDEGGIQCWVNLLDARTGHLLWIHRIDPPKAKFLWRLVGLLRYLFYCMGLSYPDTFCPHDIAATGSWDALACFARAQDDFRTWDGRVSSGIEAFKAAGRAMALDPGFEGAVRLFEELGRRLFDAAGTEAEGNSIRDAIVASRDLKPVVEMRKLAHNRLLALAKAAEQT